MIFSFEYIVMIIAALATGLLLLFAVDWRYFRDWVVVFLFQSTLSITWGAAVENLKLLKYPIRLFPEYFETSILFELWVFPLLGVLYNQVTRTRGIGAIIWYALLFSTVITAIEYPLQLYTGLIKYIQWSWFTSFYTLVITFLASRIFIAFYRWGCDYFGQVRGKNNR